MSQTREKRTRTVQSKTKIKDVTYYPCDVCEKEFTDKYNLQTHKAIHLPENLYKCTQCAYECKVKKYLARHVKKVHGKPSAHECEVCGKMFHFKCNLLTHMRVHTGEKPYKCKDCGKAFNSSYSLSTHVFIHKDEKPFQCSFCQYACRDSSTLRKHEARHTGTQKLYQCKLCNRTFEGKCKLRMHIEDEHVALGENRHPCDICGGRYKTKASLRTHIQTIHLKSKWCSCEVCGREMSSRANLPAHLRTHLDAKPYKCTHGGCHNTYKDLGAVKKHALIHHPDRQHACEICNRKFTRKHRLNKHILQHVPKKKTVICDYCGVGFYNKVYLTNHIERKHGRKRQRYECETCGLVTTNKPSIVMHLKHAHQDENDRECKICHTFYKKHMYLKMHYLKSHDIRYKMKKQTRGRKITIDVKVEPVDEEESKEIHLFEIEKEEPIDPIAEPQEVSETQDLNEEKQENEIEIPIDYIKVPGKITEEMFEEFFEKNVIKDPPLVRRKDKSKKHIIKREQKYAQQYLDKLLTKVRQRKKAIALEETRQKYNERVRAATNGKTKEKVSIRFFNNNKPSKEKDANIENDKNDDTVTEINDPLNAENNEKFNSNVTNNENIDSLNDASVVNDKIDDDGNNKSNDPLNDEIKDVGNGNNNPSNDTENNSANDDTNNENIDTLNDASVENDKNVDNNDPLDDENNDNGTNNENDDPLNDSDTNYENDSNDDDYEETKKSETTNGKIKLNTHQCYICFKLFETKPKLLQHCKEHFDICNEITLKKCPLCSYVTKLTITRHMKLVHKLDIKVPYSKIDDKISNLNGSRYCYKLNDRDIKELEIIPSVKVLNKRASMKIDEKRRLLKDTFIGKTKLVRKGKEWVVQTDSLKVDDEYILPEFDEKDIDEKLGDTYLDRLKNLYKIAKKNKCKMLFPCEKCEKICQTLSALKLHWRRHEDNPKPFKKKIWKHKIKNVKVKDKIVKVNERHRFAEPKPIQGKHKCEKELIDFYENNIKGGNIEFWQFLKIYNKMSREKIEDFKDLEGRIDFGIHPRIDIPIDKPKKLKRKIRNCFVRTIMISKREYLRRIDMIEKLREDIATRKKSIK